MTKIELSEIDNTIQLLNNTYIKMKKLETLLLQSMKIMPTANIDLLVGNQIHIGSPSGVIISETLVAAFQNIDWMDIERIETEVVNQACLMYFSLKKQLGADFSDRKFIYDDLATIYSFIAEASVKFYESDSMFDAQTIIPQKIESDGTWDYLREYYNETHDVNIMKLIESLGNNSISFSGYNQIEKFEDLIMGIYAGEDKQGNYGWLLKTIEGGMVFFIRNYSQGLIQAHQIDEFVAKKVKELSPENDLNEINQLKNLIEIIGEKHPELLPLLDEIDTIRLAYGHSKTK